MKRLLLLLFIAFPTFAQRSLSWDELAVKARLDADGRLHVLEQQTILFDGDWNGGERIFRLEPEHRLTVNGITRVADGTSIPLRAGSFAETDGYELMNGNTLRWRSRMPGDPPFRNTRITYVLDYMIENVLVKRGSGYRLAHDFAFSKREGEIRLFRLDLTLDPEWHSDDLPRHVERTSLAPGKTVVVSGSLEYRGAGAPAAEADTRSSRVGVGLLLLVVPALLWRRLVRRETNIGRLAPLETASLTPQWIAEHVLPVHAEVVGATWDEEASTNEVSALLARWAAEEKITAKPHDDELHMTLLADRDDFPGYERQLIDKLFFAGPETNTSAIRAHYKSKGFSPSTVISQGVLSKSNELTASAEPVPRVSRLPSLVFFALTVAFTVIAARRGEETAFAFFLALVASAICWIVSIFLALHWRGRIDYGLEKTRALRIVTGIPLALALAALAFDWYDWPSKIALVFAALLVANNAFNVAKSKKGPSAIAFRKRLASVRQYFIDELAKPDPALDDRWFPYVIAFGLDSHATKWMQDFGAATRSSSFGSSSTSSSSSSSSSSPSWSGGGGSFGGAGATGAWTAAAAGIAVGVSAPSSSSGGSSGGGSSSGGGGGGGW